MMLFEPVKNRNKWRQVISDYTHDLWDVISRRCSDFSELETSFHALKKSLVYDSLMQELDIIETYANNKERTPEPDMADLYKQAEDAIINFHATLPRR